MDKKTNTCMYKWTVIKIIYHTDYSPAPYTHMDSGYHRVVLFVGCVLREMSNCI